MLISTKNESTLTGSVLASALSASEIYSLSAVAQEVSHDTIPPALHYFAYTYSETDKVFIWQLTGIKTLVDLKDNSLSATVCYG